MKISPGSHGQNMVLKVAQAIHESGPTVSTPWNALDNGQLATHLRQAQAAIAAMRAPTDAMLLAAIRLDPKCVIERQWPEMIDAALAT